MDKIVYLVVNFGGPRDLEEIREFLTALLCDQEVIRTPFPPFIHRLLFRRVAKKRALKVAPDYALIGGKSPLFEDTEAIATNLSTLLGAEVLAFHRYLPKTHASFVEKMDRLDASEIRVFPLFPQFSYATTGSIALWFSTHLRQSTIDKLAWVKSYPAHPLYLRAMEGVLREFLEEQKLREEEVLLLFSAHGLPKRFIETGDIYAKECEQTFFQLKQRFPHAASYLSFQSQFGKEEWIRPYTNEVCAAISEFAAERKHVVVVPLSFPSDHIETLYEIEHLYLPLIRKSGKLAYRCPALNRRQEWVEAIAEIFQDEASLHNQMLMRIRSQGIISARRP